MNLTNIFVIIIMLLGAFGRPQRYQFPQKLRRFFHQCQCPARCIFEIKVCLQTGICRNCRISPYGKRQNGFLPSVLPTQSSFVDRISPSTHLSDMHM